MSELSNQIAATAAFFDIFDYPLTDFEIWQYLDVPAPYADVRADIRSRNGDAPLFCLHDASRLASIRRERYAVTQAKIRTARRRLTLIAWIPWIRLIALANVIGTHNLRAEGDIDLFIVTKKNRLWLVKLIATAILALTRLRPRRGTVRDTLCLSFLVDETALDLSVFRLDADRYLTYWLDGLIPLYGDKSAYPQLIEANPWLRTALPNRLPKHDSGQRFTLKRWRIMPEFGLGTIMERIARLLLRFIMSPEIKRALSRPGSGVVVTDHVLKLHTGDRRQHFRKEYEKRLRLYATS